MQNKLFLKAADICELLEVKQTSAYEIAYSASTEHGFRKHLNSHSGYI